MTTQSPRPFAGLTYPLRRVVGEGLVLREHRNAEGDVVRTTEVRVFELECGHVTQPPDRHTSRARMRRCTECRPRELKAEAQMPTCGHACPNSAPFAFCDKAQGHHDEHECEHPSGGRMHWPNLGPFPGPTSGLREELAALAERVNRLGAYQGMVPKPVVAHIMGLEKQLGELNEAVAETPLTPEQERALRDALEPFDCRSCNGMLGPENCARCHVVRKHRLNDIIAGVPGLLAALDAERGRTKQAEARVAEVASALEDAADVLHEHGYPIIAAEFRTVLAAGPSRCTACGGLRDPGDAGIGEQEQRRRAEAAEARNAEIETAIRKHRDQRGDDRCWMDDDELYGVLPEPVPPRPLPPPDVMLAKCRRFIASRATPGAGTDRGPEGRWCAAAEIAAQEAARVENVRLRDAIERRDRFLTLPVWYVDQEQQPPLRHVIRVGGGFACGYVPPNGPPRTIPANYDGKVPCCPACEAALKEAAGW